MSVLKPQVGGITLHLAFQIFHQLVGVATENLLYVLDLLAIFLGRNLAGAASRALLYVIFQTQSPLPLFNIIAGNGQAACPDGIEFLNQFEHSPRNADIRIRSKLFGTVLDVLAGHEDARIKLVGDNNPWIGLVVFQQDIIARLMLLDH